MDDHAVFESDIEEPPAEMSKLRLALLCFSCATTLFAVSSSATIVSPYAPTIAQEFSLNAEQIGLIFSAYSFAILPSTLIAGIFVFVI